MIGVRRCSGRVLVMLGSSCCSAGVRVGSRRVDVLVAKGMIVDFARDGGPMFRGTCGTVRSSVLGVHQGGDKLLLTFLLGAVVTGLIRSTSGIRRVLRSVRRALLSVGGSRNGVKLLVRRHQGRCVIVHGGDRPLGRRFTGLLHARGKVVDSSVLPVCGSLSSRLRFVVRAARDYQRVVSSLISLCVSGGSLHVGTVVGHLAVMSAVFVPLAFLTNV